MKVRIAGLERNSIVDGEGLRYVIFTQGCKHECIGCQNPETWDFCGGTDMETEELLNEILSDPIIDGVTLSGGDPFYQAKELITLVKDIKEHNLTIWAYTGYKFEQFVEFMNTHKKKNGINDNMIELLKYVDVLVDGPFELEKRTLSLSFRGSYNQRLIDVQESLKSNKIIEYTIKE